MWVSLFKSATVQEPRWWRSRWPWNASLSTGASGIHPQIEQLSQNTDWIPAGVLDYQKGLCRSMHDLVGMKGRREKDKTGQDQHPGAGELKRRRDSHIQRNWLGQKGGVWGCQRVNRWSVTLWTEWETHRQSTPWPCTPYPRLGHMSTGVHGAGSCSVGTGEQFQDKDYRDQPSSVLEGLLGRLRWILTHNVGKDCDSRDPKKTFIIFMFSSVHCWFWVFCSILFCFLLFSLLLWLLCYYFCSGFGDFKSYF